MPLLPGGKTAERKKKKNVPPKVGEGSPRKVDDQGDNLWSPWSQVGAPEVDQCGVGGQEDDRVDVPLLDDCQEDNQINVPSWDEGQEHNNHQDIYQVDVPSWLDGGQEDRQLEIIWLDKDRGACSGALDLDPHCPPPRAQVPQSGDEEQVKEPGEDAVASGPEHSGSLQAQGSGDKDQV